MIARARWWIAGGAVASTALLGLGAVAVVSALSGSGVFLDDAAVRAAVRQYEQRSGLRGIGVASAEGWSDCAVVQLDRIPGRGVLSVVMIRTGGAWTLARTETDEDPFDLDSVHDAADCRDEASLGVEPAGSGRLSGALVPAADR